jgi:hypothetical protein
MDSAWLLTTGNENNYSPRVVLNLLMHDGDPLAFMNGFRQISTCRNLSGITSTNKEIAAGLIRRFEHSAGRVALSRERHLSHALVATAQTKYRLPLPPWRSIDSQAKGEDITT